MLSAFYIYNIIEHKYVNLTKIIQIECSSKSNIKHNYLFIL